QRPHDTDLVINKGTPNWIVLLRHLQPGFAPEPEIMQHIALQQLTGNFAQPHIGLLVHCIKRSSTYFGCYTAVKVEYILVQYDFSPLYQLYVRNWMFF